MSKSMTLTSRMGGGHSCSSCPSWACLSLGCRQGPAPLYSSPGEQTWSCVSSRVQGSTCEALVEASLLGKRCPHLALMLGWGSGGWGGLEEVLGQLRAEEGHLREPVPTGT